MPKRTERATAGLKHLSRALRHRNYRLFFAGQGTSLIGTWMQSVAQAWLVYRLTGSAALLGLAGFSGQLPIFLLSPFGGELADKVDRRLVLLSTQAASMLLAFALSWLTLSGRVEVWHIFLLASLLGMVNAFDVPARQSLVIDLVGREDLVNAIALNSTIFNAARTIGPALAGAMVAAVGEGWCFFLNGISYIAAIAAINSIRVSRSPGMPAGPEAAGAGSVLARIREGFAFVGRTPPIRALLLLLGLTSLLGMSFTVLMPVFADRILGGGPGAMGLLMGASGVGALAGALALAARRDAKGLGLAVCLSAAGFGTSLVLFSMSRDLHLSALLLVPVGFCMIYYAAGSNTLIQMMSPNALRGRIMAVYSMMVLGMAPFGALTAGCVAQQFGAPLTVALGGAATMVAALVFGRNLPSLREQGRRLIEANNPAGPGSIRE